MKNGLKQGGYNTVNSIISCNSQCINSLYNTCIIEITIALESVQKPINILIG